MYQWGGYPHAFFWRVVFHARLKISRKGFNSSSLLPLTDVLMSACVKQGNTTNHEKISNSYRTGLESRTRNRVHEADRKLFGDKDRALKFLSNVVAAT